MSGRESISANKGDTLLMVGTMKGAFLFHSDASRQSWQWSGPYFPGNAVYAMAYDGRKGRDRIWAGVQSMHWGAVLRTSDDFGGNWTNPEEANIRFPAGAEWSLKNIWQITRGPAGQPDTLYCGVEPAALFVTHDAGESWSLVQGLYDHPHRARWEPGFGGLCLHTVLPDPADDQRITVAISTGGVYQSADGGKSWSAKNNGVRAEFLPDKHPEFGQCVHKIAQHPKHPQRLYLQNHWGLYKSEDGGESWQDIANGVPSDFGFPMVVHPDDPDTAYIIPLTSDEFRTVPEKKLRVYRTRDAGRSWEPLTNGLPQEEAYECVLRDSMAAAAGTPAGIYFGTRSGRVYGSNDDGDSWSLLHGSLPPVTCVKAARIGE
jgi:hypothetical protein